MTLKDEAKSTAASMKEDLQELRDTIRVKLHLGSMDLRDRFEQLEPKVKDFEHRAEKVTAEAGAELKEGWTHLKLALTSIKKELESSKKN